MVDAYKADSVSFLKTLKNDSVPDSLKNKSSAELQKIIKNKSDERAAIQREILALSATRDAYVAAERKKLATDNTQTLETEVEKIIKEQVKRFKMYIE
jgi:hypothetical protein